MNIAVAYLIEEIRSEYNRLRRRFTCGRWKADASFEVELSPTGKEALPNFLPRLCNYPWELRFRNKPVCTAASAEVFLDWNFVRDYSVVICA